MQAGEKWEKVELALSMAQGLLLEVHAETSSVRFTDRGGWAGRSQRVLARIDEAQAALDANHNEVRVLREALAGSRLTLRWAWAKLGCRCIFDPDHNKIHEDAHCPVHGLATPEDPEGWEALTHPHNAQEAR